MHNECEVSDNIDHEWQSFLWTKAKRSTCGLADARFDGQLILEDITIISVVYDSPDGVNIYPFQPPNIVGSW